MFGTNQITGRAHFVNAQKDQLLVTSIFLSLQGEGPFQGQPAIFVRLAKCNLACAFCDSWFEQGDDFSIDRLTTELFDIARRQYGSVKQVGIVVTGGEPSLQTTVVQLLSNCQKIGFAFTQIESNGILALENLPLETVLVISPKCKERSKNVKGYMQYIAPHAHNLTRANCLKFVVTADFDSPYHEIPDWAFEWQKQTNNKIYISPMNVYRQTAIDAARKRIAENKLHDIKQRSTIDEVVSAWDDTILDREQSRKNHEYAFRYCVQHGLFLTLQMHLFGSAA